MDASLCWMWLQSAAVRCPFVSSQGRGDVPFSHHEPPTVWQERLCASPWLVGKLSSALKSPFLWVNIYINGTLWALRLTHVTVTLAVNGCAGFKITACLLYCTMSVLHEQPGSGWMRLQWLGHSSCPQHSTCTSCSCDTAWAKCLS